jgi:hypothetical protein
MVTFFFFVSSMNNETLVSGVMYNVFQELKGPGGSMS